jgi:hypothetical protein
VSQDDTFRHPAHWPQHSCDVNSCGLFLDETFRECGAMPTIAHIGSIDIRIYHDDHGVPHQLAREGKPLQDVED